MNDVIQDERYNVVSEAILDAFFMLAKEKDFEKITVSDIIKRAGIVRSTFYNHYENIPALIEDIENKTVNDIFSILDTFHPKDNADMCRSYYLILCEYTKDNPFLAELLRSPRASKFLEKTISMFHTYVNGIINTSNIPKEKLDKYSYMIACTIGGTIGVLHKWTTDNFSTPTDVIADILTQTFMTVLFPFIQ